jgi:hypothetical protein
MVVGKVFLCLMIAVLTFKQSFIADITEIGFVDEKKRRCL